MVVLSFIFCLVSLICVCVFHKEISKMWVFLLAMSFTANMAAVLKTLVESV